MIVSNKAPYSDATMLVFVHFNWARRCCCRRCPSHCFACLFLLFGKYLEDEKKNAKLFSLRKEWNDELFACRSVLQRSVRILCVYIFMGQKCLSLSMLLLRFFSILVQNFSVFYSTAMANRKVLASFSRRRFDCIRRKHMSVKPIQTVYTRNELNASKRTASRLNFVVHTQTRTRAPALSRRIHIIIIIITFQFNTPAAFMQWIQRVCLTLVFIFRLRSAISSHPFNRYFQFS